MNTLRLHKKLCLLLTAIIVLSLIPVQTTAPAIADANGDAVGVVLEQAQSLQPEVSAASTTLQGGSSFGAPGHTPLPTQTLPNTNTPVESLAPQATQPEGTLESPQPTPAAADVQTEIDALEPQAGLLGGIGDIVPFNEGSYVSVDDQSFTYTTSTIRVLITQHEDCSVNIYIDNVYQTRTGMMGNVSAIYIQCPPAGTRILSFEVTPFQQNTPVIETITATLTINKASNALSVTCADTTVGEVVSPVITNPHGGTATVMYKPETADDNAYRANVPPAPGRYTVRVTSAETANYNANTATANFIIYPAVPIASSQQDSPVGSDISFLTVNVPYGTEVHWYDAPAGGTLLAPSTSLTPTATTYYAEAVDSLTGLASLTRTAVTAKTVKTVPTVSSFLDSSFVAEYGNVSLPQWGVAFDTQNLSSITIHAFIGSICGSDAIYSFNGYYMGDIHLFTDADLVLLNNLPPADYDIKLESSGNEATHGFDLTIGTATIVGVTGIRIPAMVEDIPAGSNHLFTANVTVHETVDHTVDTSVSWQVTGQSSAGTTIAPDGTLTIARDETAAALTVTATTYGRPQLQASEEVTVLPYVPVPSGLSLSCANIIYGQMPSPQVANPGDGPQIVMYKARGAADSAYSAVLPSNVGEYTVRVTTAATAYYVAATATADFSIIQATPTVKSPHVTAAVQNQTRLSELALQGGKASGIGGQRLDGRFVWQSPKTSVKVSGQYNALFIPENTNYQTVACAVKIKIGSTAPVIVSLSATPVGTSGATLAVVAMQGTPPFTYQWQLKEPWADIPGATTAQFEYQGLELDQAYTVCVLVTDALGNTITSPEITFTAGAQPITNLPAAYTLTKGQKASFSPLPAGGDWTYDKAHVAFEQNGDEVTFTALKTGETHVTYTAGGTQHIIFITSDTVALPSMVAAGIS